MNKIIQDRTNLRYCFFDAETENLTLHECNNKPWQVSFIIVDNSGIIKEFDYYIKWKEGLKVSKGAALATRFNPDIVEELGVSPEKVLQIMDAEFKKCDHIVGHNILGFDAYVVMGMYRKLGKTPFNMYPKAIDTLSLARGWKTEQMPKRGDNFTAWQLRMIHKRTRGIKASLGALGKEFEIEHDYENLHNALCDLRLNIKVFNRLRKFFFTH